jgi:hypothetical protein
MAHFVGLDVSVKETSVCVVDNAGTVIWEQKVPTEPAAIIAVLSSLAVPFGRIGIEAGPLSQWLVNALIAADPAADQRQGRPTDCTAPSFSSHHEAACADLEEKRELPVGTSAEAKKGNGMR